MPRLRPTLSLALLLSARLALAEAPPSATDLELAKAHYRTGELNYERGKFSDAAKEFEEAYRLSGRAELLYNMGKAYDGEGNLRGALAAYRRFLTSVARSADRAFVERRVGELALLVGHLEISASVAGATVVLDGQRLGTTPLPEPRLEVNPGEHTVEISAEGYATFREKPAIARGATARVDAKLVSLVKVIRVEEKHVPIYKRWYLWTAVGLVVAAGVTTGAVLGVRAANSIDGPSLQLPKVQ